MAEALVSPVVGQLGSIMARELEQEVRLVVGVEKEVEKLTSNLTAIQAVLTDAEIRQVKEATVRDWLGKLREVAYDIEDVLGDWETAILNSQNKPERKVCSLQSSCFFCKQLGLRHDIARKIKELNERLDKIAQEKDRYQLVQREGNPPDERYMTTTSMIDTTEVKGREEDKNKLINMLLSEPNDGDRSDLRVISMVGMGGIGKTTLAQFAFNNERIMTYFDKKIWICVSDPFDEIRIAKAILESLLGSAPGVTELESLLQQIRENIKEKRILLIMDDVWEDNSRKWDQLKQSFKFASRGSKILLTTRKDNVAVVMGCSRDGILNVGLLSDEECWLIVSKIAFFDRSDIECQDLEKIFRREISKKCRGLPLAAKTLGGILLFRKTKEEWQSVLRSEVWELEEGRRDIIAPLWLSYHDLSPALKRCFSYCAIFPKDHEIEKRVLIELWMAQGYLKEGQSDNIEIIGDKFFQNLTMRSFFQDFRKDCFHNRMIISCKMHDMVHDLAQLVAGDECLGVQVNGRVESIMGSISTKVRHLSLERTPSSSDISTSSFNSFEATKKLRSIFISGQLTTEDLLKLFSESTHLRTLSLRGGNFAEIPPSIRKLVQLRWLDLSWNDQLEQLSETLCELHSLQTIDVSGCLDLKQLPLGIGKLINLRHLHNRPGGPKRLPKGIGQLTGLRTLEGVNVGCDDDDDAFSLSDLKNLNQLQGRLLIDRLGAYNRHVGEAKQAELKKKEHITELALSFSGSRGDEEALLLEALEPSPNVEFLRINFYQGTTFPGWMISLRNLRSIFLMSCESCEHLPSLGKLPCLETLRLWGMSGVKKVGQDLLGIETQFGDSKSEISASLSSSSSSPVVVAFPKLTKLIFLEMHSWEEWEDYYNDNYGGTNKPPPISIMPSLLSLSIGDCPRLKALPNYILQNTTLQINDCNLLEQRYNKERGEDWSKISHVFKIF